MNQVWPCRPSNQLTRGSLERDENLTMNTRWRTGPADWPENSANQNEVRWRELHDAVCDIPCLNEKTRRCGGGCLQGLGPAAFAEPPPQRRGDCIGLFQDFKGFYVSNKSERIHDTIRPFARLQPEFE